MSSKALMVFTRKTKEFLLEEGGTSAWALRPNIVRKFDYVICTRNTSPDDEDPHGPGPEPRGQAFLVGKIESVDFLYNANSRDRYIVRFSEIAEVAVPNVWDGMRNPVRYIEIDDLRQRGLDPEKLDFKPIRPIEQTAQRAEIEAVEELAELPAVRPLTIAEAKAGLAAAFGIPIEAVEITIRG